VGGLSCQGGIGQIGKTETRRAVAQGTMVKFERMNKNVVKISVNLARPSGLSGAAWYDYSGARDRRRKDTSSLPVVLDARALTRVSSKGFGMVQARTPARRRARGNRSNIGLPTL
jgi:hypothetical protein